MASKSIWKIKPHSNVIALDRKISKQVAFILKNEYVFFPTGRDECSPLLIRGHFLGN